MRGEDEEPTNAPPKDKKKVEKPRAEEEAVEDLPWYRKYKEHLIGVVILVIFVIILISIFAANGGGDDGDDSDKSINIDPTQAPSAAIGEGPSGGTPSGGTLPPGATLAPTTFFDFLDKDKDGLAEFECDQEPYFDNAGRLIIAGCDAS